MSVYPNLEDRFKLLEEKIIDAKTDIDNGIKNIEDRITELEKLCIILRAKVEPYSLNPIGLGRARRLMRDRKC